MFLLWGPPEYEEGEDYLLGAYESEEDAYAAADWLNSVNTFKKPLQEENRQYYVESPIMNPVVPKKTPLTWFVQAVYTEESGKWEITTCQIMIDHVYDEAFYHSCAVFPNCPPRWGASLYIRADSATNAMKRMMKRCRKIDFDDDLEKGKQVNERVFGHAK